MRFKIKLFLQCISVAFLILVLICLAYHELPSSFHEKTGGDSASVERSPARWRERAPRSLNSFKPNDYDTYLQEIDPQNIVMATATVKPATNLNDIFISVKTTKSFHPTRLDIIIKTWFDKAKDQTWFFTDTNDEEYNRKTGGHLINTNCSSSHSRKALCCKMSREFDSFLESNKRWWCHFDDDNYVNIPALVKTLESFDPLQDWYLGRPSIRAPLEIINRDNLSQKISFWFATGGAGFCISRSLALKMMPLAGGGKFISVGEKIRLPDDVTMGYIIEHLLRKKLTIVEEFHSHLEPMRFISLDNLDNQISFGYSNYGTEMNVLSIPGLPDRVDPTRMYSLHCRLFPASIYCPR